MVTINSQHTAITWFGGGGGGGYFSYLTVRSAAIPTQALYGFHIYKNRQQFDWFLLSQSRFSFKKMLKFFLFCSWNNVFFRIVHVSPNFLKFDPHNILVEHHPVFVVNISVFRFSLTLQDKALTQIF